MGLAARRGADRRTTMELDGTMKQAVVGWDLSRVVFRDLERDYPVVERGE